MAEALLSAAAGMAARAQTNALRVAQEAAAHVPAYARFLRLSGYDAARLKSYADFTALPITDKQSYLAAYPLAQRCRGGQLPRAHMVTISSGTAGPATLWPRFPEQDATLFAGVTGLLQEHFRVRERWTLVVIAAAMGAWGFATSATQVCQRLFAQQGMRGTVVTPGLNADDALGFIEQLSPEYDQTILVGYPALLVSLLEAGAQRGIDWARLNTGMFTSGEAVSEAQRERILKLLGKDPDRLAGFASGFGATEYAGLIGYESRLCLLIRRLCTHDPSLTGALFGTPVLPSINQYNPLGAYLEVHEGQLLLTARGAVPLVRYNTHDLGGLLSCAELFARCRAHGVDLGVELAARGIAVEACRPFPFLYGLGRSDAVIIHGGNLYFHEVQHVVERAELRDSNTGQFRLTAETTPDGWVVLRLAVELRPDVVATDELQARYDELVTRGLLEASTRFRAAYDASQGKVRVEVNLTPYGGLELRGPKSERVVLTEPPVAQPTGSPTS